MGALQAMKKDVLDYFTPDEVREIAFDGTVSSVHAALNDFIRIMQGRSRRKKIPDEIFRRAVVKGFLESAFVLARCDYGIEEALELMSAILNEEARFEQDEGWTGEKLV